MNKSKIKQSNQLNLSIVIAICSLLIGLPTKAVADSSYSQTNSTLVSDNSDKPNRMVSLRQGEELEAYSSSEYNYCDAILLAYFWDSSVLESKARIGRKVIWEDGGIPYLEQYLVDARTQALKESSPQCSFTDGGYSYDDAVALAEFWGDPSPWEAKERIARNLMLGNQNEIESALEKVGR